MLASVADNALSNYPKVRTLAKIAGSVLIAITGRKYPVASAAAIGALAASSGYPLGVKLAGGMVARNPTEAVKGLGEMSESYPEMGALLSGGVGALLSGMGAPPNVPSVVTDYTTALNNMAGEDD